MQIGFGKKFIFVANTKTASTSIESALIRYADIVRTGDPRRKHTSLYEAIRSYPIVFRNQHHAPEAYFKFGVMRDPIDWIGSWYRYRSGNRVESPLPQDMSFADFWKQADWNIRYANGQKHLQRDMFCASDGTLLADVIIPYAQVSEVFHEICQILKIDCPLPRHNVSRRTNTGWIPDNLRDEMRDYYAEDYALYNRLDEINAQGLALLRAGKGGFRPFQEVAPASQQA
jgi:Sulfotransferase family